MPLVVDLGFVLRECWPSSLGFLISPCVFPVFLCDFTLNSCAIWFQQYCHPLLWFFNFSSVVSGVLFRALHFFLSSWRCSVLHDLHLTMFPTCLDSWQANRFPPAPIWTGWRRFVSSEFAQLLPCISPLALSPASASSELFVCIPQTVRLFVRIPHRWWSTVTPRTQRTRASCLTWSTPSNLALWWENGWLLAVHSFHFRISSQIVAFPNVLLYFHL